MTGRVTKAEVHVEQVFGVTLDDREVPLDVGLRLIADYGVGTLDFRSLDELDDFDDLAVGDTPRVTITQAHGWSRRMRVYEILPGRNMRLKRIAPTRG